ncbi:hypothetical protein IHE31_08395 [Mycetohabitans rhizoxinica]|uniref:hypothetical protein n=1 Tax=Mycetohabitans rhizoxinica TaxID=412963 RepID=UPI0030CB40E0
MTGTLITVADAFRAALIAPGHTGTTAHRVTHIGLCTASFDASNRSLTQLPYELKRIDTFGGQLIDATTIHITMHDDSPDQYALYGFGLYLEDGTLAAYYSQPVGHGPIMEKSAAATLLLSTDIRFVTIDAATLEFGPASFLNPPATTDARGVVELATQAEVNAGKDDSRVLTPRTAARRYAPRDWVLTHALPLRGELDAHADLNTLVTSGIYHQTYQAGHAAASLNYPVPVPGRLQVYAAGRTVYQTYSLFNSSVHYTRVRYNGLWSTWRRLLDDASDVLVNGIGAFYGTLTDLPTPRAGVIVGANSGGRIVFHCPHAPADQKVWDVKTSTNAFDARLLDDTGATIRPWLTVNRTGTSVTTVQLARSGGRVLIGEGATDDGASTLQVAGIATAATPVVGDVSRKLATTQFVANAIREASIGQIIIEARTTVRAGCLKLAGVLIQRDDYPQLWTYAQTCGALVSEDEWPYHPGCFSTGDGKTTFRIPEVRGEHLRFWDDGRGVDPGRGIGTWQDSQNRRHAHLAKAAWAGEHHHTGLTDEQGHHQHGGHAHPVGDHQHISPWGEHSSSYDPPWGRWGGNNLVGSQRTDADNMWGMTSWSGGHDHSLQIDPAGQHRHTVHLDADGIHTHAVIINHDGGKEARPCNIALLAMIRAY